MTNLTPRQTDLLAHALAQGGQLFPLPTHLGPLALAKRSITPLLRRRLLVEVVVDEVESAWRSSDGLHYGLQLTSLGRSLIEPVVAIPVSYPVLPKIAHVKALLERDGGVAMDEIISVTGWLPHSARAALSGLRKKGYVILRATGADGSHYRIVA